MEFEKDPQKLRSGSYIGQNDHYKFKKRIKNALFQKIITDFYKNSDYFELHALNSI